MHVSRFSISFIVGVIISEEQISYNQSSSSVLLYVHREHNDH